MMVRREDVQLFKAAEILLFVIVTGGFDKSW